MTDECQIGEVWKQHGGGVYLIGIKEAEELRKKQKVGDGERPCRTMNIVLCDCWLTNLVTRSCYRVYLTFQTTLSVNLAWCQQNLEKHFFPVCAWLDDEIWGQVHPALAFPGVIEQQALHFLPRLRPGFFFCPIFLNRKHVRLASTPFIIREKSLKDSTKPPTQREHTGQTSDSRFTDINLFFKWAFEGKH